VGRTTKPRDWAGDGSDAAGCHPGQLVPRPWIGRQSGTNIQHIRNSIQHCCDLLSLSHVRRAISRASMRCDTDTEAAVGQELRAGMC
jgi:hypothetical protein